MLQSVALEMSLDPFGDVLRWYRYPPEAAPLGCNLQSRAHSTFLRLCSSREVDFKGRRAQREERRWD